MMAKACIELDVPVIASGATATGRQLAAALAMGAQGVTMATRFLATVEAPIKQSIKEHLASDLVDERSTSVVMSSLNNSTRVIKNEVALKILEIEKEWQLAPEKIDFGILAPLAAGKQTKEMWQETGDVQGAMWSCGQSVGLIHDIPTCKVLIERMVAEAEEQLSKASSLCSPKARL
jgi:NAD(P)H-dependent flavin oxidoreductase YrpB (nitropropane dioxygenase family)